MGSSISHKMQVEEERGVRHARKSSDVEDGDGRAEEGQGKTGKKTILYLYFYLLYF